MKPLLLCLALAIPMGAQTYQPNWSSIDAPASPAWYTDAKFGIFIHWGVYSVPAYAPVDAGRDAYAEWYWNSLDRRRHAATPRPKRHRNGHLGIPTSKSTAPTSPTSISRPMFRAELYDPDHWADVFARSGAKYVALTSKHHEGFTLWHSEEANRDLGTSVERRGYRPASATSLST